MALSAAQWILTLMILFLVMALVIWVFVHIGQKTASPPSAAESESETVTKKQEEKEKEPNNRMMKAEPSTVEDSNNFEEHLANLISVGKSLIDDDDIPMPRSDIADGFDLGSFLKSNDIARNEAMMVMEKTSQPATDVYNTTFNVLDAAVTFSNSENDTPNILPITSIKAPSMSLDISSSHSPLLSYKDNEIKSLIPNSLSKAHASDPNISNFSFVKSKSPKSAEEDTEQSGIGIQKKYAFF